MSEEVAAQSVSEGMSLITLGKQGSEVRGNVFHHVWCCQLSSNCNKVLKGELFVALKIVNASQKGLFYFKLQMKATN